MPHDPILLSVIAIGTVCVIMKQLRPAWPVYRYMAVAGAAVLLISALTTYILLQSGKGRTSHTDEQLAAQLNISLPPLIAQREASDKKAEEDWQSALNMGADNPALIPQFSQMLNVHDALTQCRRDLETLSALDRDFPSSVQRALRESPLGNSITSEQIAAIQGEFPSDILRDLDKAKDCSAVFLLTTCDVLMMTRGQWYVANGQVIFADPKISAEYNSGMADYKKSADTVKLLLSKLQASSPAPIRPPPGFVSEPIYPTK